MAITCDLPRCNRSAENGVTLVERSTTAHYCTVAHMILHQIATLSAVSYAQSTSKLKQAYKMAHSVIEKLVKAIEKEWEKSGDPRETGEKS